MADPRRRERAREYARIRRRLLLVDLALSAASLAVLLVSGLSVWIRDVLAGAVPGYFGVLVAYVTLLTIASAVVFLPLAYVSGFVLPHRYDLSVQPRRGWLADYVKGTLVGLAQAVIVALPVYALLRYAPQWWWLWAGLVLALFGVVLANLAPVLIVPLFYKLQPLDDLHLRDRLVSLAEAAGTRVRGVYVIDLSRRTRAANAALMGIGNTRRIVLGDTLLSAFEPAEAEAVLAHELGHHVHHDLWRGIALDGGLTLLAFWLADQVAGRLAGSLGLDGLADVAAMPLVLLVAGGLFVLVLPVTNGFSRRREAAADWFAVRATGNPDAWKGALRKLADQNLAEVDPPRWVEWMLYSHPSIRHRLEAAGRTQVVPRDTFKIRRR
ncbi:MAG: M48 family metallopeptidase [Chloroflexota bacterium]